MHDVIENLADVFLIFLLFLHLLCFCKKKSFNCQVSLEIDFTFYFYEIQYLQILISSRSVLVQAHLTKITSKSFPYVGKYATVSCMKPLGLQFSSCPGFSSQVKKFGVDISLLVHPTLLDILIGTS